MIIYRLSNEQLNFSLIHLGIYVPSNPLYLKDNVLDMVAVMDPAHK
jgi:hypothetical protein